MQPDNQAGQQTQMPNVKKRNRTTGFEPKWRHFHPHATVFLRNPFKEDVLFQVADEDNTPYQYRLPAGQLCELPGGAIATLGVKEVVDKLINESQEDAIRIWEKSVRKRHEDKVIERIKEPAQRPAGGPKGAIDLGSSEEGQDEPLAKDEPEQEFPTLNQSKSQQPQPPTPDTSGPVRPPAAPVDRPVNPQEAQNQEQVRAVAAASLGGTNQVVDED
jgi:hypothetical protein